MGTGAGKSLLFMLPAAIGAEQGGVTIVIVPLTALRGDLVARCEQAGIRASAWDGWETGADYCGSSVIFVTPEGSQTAAFRRFLDTKRGMRQLDRIVLDECHVALESDEKWRPAYLELKELLGKAVQMVFLTATLPPVEEEQFYTLMRLPRHETVQFRGPTRRRNVRYRILSYEKQQELQTVRTLVEQKLTEHTGQVIIYCETVAQVKRIGKELGYTMFYREIGSEAEKLKIVGSLTNEQERVFVATNALGLGIDAPRIRVVIHIGLRRQLKQYAQESGRAGRDGEMSEAIILRACWVDRQGRKKLDPGAKEMEKAMKEFIETKQCRRLILDAYMDGSGRECEDDEPCDLCYEGQQLTREEAAITIRGKRQRGESDVRAEQVFYTQRREREFLARTLGHETQREARKVEILEEKLTRWAIGCVICRAMDKQEIEIGHEVQRCPVREERENFELIMGGVMKEVDFERFSGCTTCGVPYMLCGRFRMKSGSEQHQQWQLDRGRWCRFERGVLEQAVGALMTYQIACREQMEAAAAGAWKGDSGSSAAEQMRIWLGGRMRWGEIETNRMCETLVRWG